MKIPNERVKVERKYCPLGKPGEYFCIENECAWWDKFVEECAILSIANFGISHVGIKSVKKK